MKRTMILAAVFATAALSMSAARAQVSVSINTPEFGIRVGAPVYRPAPVPVYLPPRVVVPVPVYGRPVGYPPPVYAPPVYAPPVYAPPAYMSPPIYAPRVYLPRTYTPVYVAPRVVYRGHSGVVFAPRGKHQHWNKHRRVHRPGAGWR